MWITFIKPYFSNGVEIFSKNDDAHFNRRSAKEFIEKSYAIESKL